MTNAMQRESAGYEVVFVRKWTDTTRHGHMQEYPASDKPVRLVKIAADAAILSGCAILPPSNPEEAAGAGEEETLADD